MALAAGLIVSCRLEAARCEAYCFMSPFGYSLRGLLFHVALRLLAAGLIVSCRFVAVAAGLIISCRLVAARCGVYCFMSPCGYSLWGLLCHSALWRLLRVFCFILPCSCSLRGLLFHAALWRSLRGSFYIFRN